MTNVEISDLADLDAFLLLRAPLSVESKDWWRSKTRNNRLILIVDAVNELYRRARDEEDRRAIRHLLFGRHRRAVIGFSRHANDLRSPAMPGGRQIIEVRLLPFSPEDRRRYLKEQGLDPKRALEAINAAGLTELSLNPHILSHILNILRAEPEAHLPRTRAGIFVRSLQQVEAKRLSAEDREIFRDDAPFSAVAEAAGLLAAPVTHGERSFNARDLAALLGRVWVRDRNLELKALAFSNTYWVRESEPRSVTRSALFQHDRLADFCLAYSFRRAPVPPDFLAHGEFDLGATLADWVGLQAAPIEAVNLVIDYCNAHRRGELLIDCVEANRGALTREARGRIWHHVAWLFTRSADIRLQIIDKLPHLSRLSRREILCYGLERTFSELNPAFGGDAADAFLGGAFTIKLWRRLQRGYRASRYVASSSITATTPQSSEIEEQDRQVDRSTPRRWTRGSCRRAATWSSRRTASEKNAAGDA